MEEESSMDRNKKVLLRFPDEWCKTAFAGERAFAFSSSITSACVREEYSCLSASVVSLLLLDRVLKTDITH